MKIRMSNLKIAVLSGYIIFFLIASCHRNMIAQDKTGDLYPDKSISIKYHSEWSENHYTERVEEFKKEPLNFGDIVFIGNSITEGGNDWSARFGISNVRNRGISGDVTDGVLARLDEIIYYKPKAVFLLIGINDLFNMYYQKQIPSPEYVGNNILKIAQIIHSKTPDTKIYIQTVLPTSEGYMKNNINIVNVIIKSHEKDGVYEVIDLHTVFLNDNGLLKTDYTYDGTHLNDNGYDAWVNYVKPYVIPK